MTFLMKTSETKKFVKIFGEAFLIYKKNSASTIQDYFHFYKKGFLNTQAVRVRVKQKHTKGTCNGRYPKKHNPTTTSHKYVR
jgi:hypothetical protein